MLAVKYLREGNPSTAFNLGSSTGFSNLQILEAARKVTGKEIPAELADRRPGDPDTLIASSDKAREVLGWKPQFDDIEKIIASAWAWHSSHPNGIMIDKYNRTPSSTWCPVLDYKRKYYGNY